MAVTVVNLEQLSNTPEYQDVRSNIQVHLVATMGQMAKLVKRAQAVTYTSATSGHGHRSRISQPPSGSRRNHSPPDDAREGNNSDDNRAQCNHGAHHNVHD